LSNNKRDEEIIVELYRDALEFYADEDNYIYEIRYVPAQEINCMLMDDRGYVARKALAEGRKEDA